jgi:transposase
MPSFGGGRPPKLDEDEQDELVEMLRDGQPWKSQEIQHLLQEEFGVSYSPNYLDTFLRNLGLSYAKHGQGVHIDQKNPPNSSGVSTSGLRH